MSSHQILGDALYCEEHCWDSFTQGEGEVGGGGENDTSVDIYYNTPFLEQNDDELTSLLHKEQESQLHQHNYPSLATARAEAVEWMLKVVRYYSFSALTAVLAVNYFDRFVHTFKFHGEKPWMTQLAAVACISLAAKVEETHVPLLLDLQVCPRFSSPLSLSFIID